MIPISLFYPKDSYLVEPIDEKLIWYQCSGLMSYWASKEMDFKYLSYKSESNGPKAMAVQHFSGTFQIWIFACALSCVIFIAELFWNAGKSSLRRRKESRIGSSIFQK